MRTYKPRALVESAFMTAIVVVMLLVYFIMPLLGFVINFVLPIPFALVVYRHNVKWSIFTCLVSILIVSLLVNPIMALVEMLTYGGMGIALGYAHKKRWSDLKHLLVPSGIFLIGLVLVGIVSYVILGIDLLAQFNNLLAQSTENALHIYKTMGMAEKDYLQMQALMEATRKQIIVILPGYLLVVSMVLVFINNFFVNFIFKRLGLPEKKFSPLYRWEMPRMALYFFILAWIMEYWGAKWDHQWLVDVSTNIRLITLVLFWVQGLAFFRYIVEVRQWHKAVFTFVFIASLFVPLITSLLTGAGIMDLVLRFRKKRDYR